MTLNYAIHDPRGWCGDPSRGAALGRPTVQDVTLDYAGRIHVRRIRLNRGGYDRNGTYFGLDSPLYWAVNDDNTVDYVLRAADREVAIAAVRSRFPRAEVRR